MKPAGAAALEDAALVALGQELVARGYGFVTPTPLTHARVVARQRPASDPLRALFGWSVAVPRNDVPANVIEIMSSAGVLRDANGNVASSVRFSSLGEKLFLHSAHPTSGTDAVFFGPDTYRFANAVRAAAVQFRARRSCRVVDIGCGSGAGGMAAVLALGPSVRTALILSDINPVALRYAAINAQINGVTSVHTVQSDVLDGVEGDADLIIANPPYLVDGAKRAYRHGGGRWGHDLSVRIARECVPRLARRGRFVLYTGTAIVEGRDVLHAALGDALNGFGWPWTYEELDPDVFGEELETEPYDAAERIAVVLVTVDNAGG